jgi:hypothetical protein
MAFLFFGCRQNPRWEKQKETVVDFGSGRIRLPRDFRFDPGKTEREPDSIRLYFSRVNDTHLNGQTSYAEGLVVTYLSPRLDDPEFQRRLQQAAYDAMSLRHPERIEHDGSLEWQSGSGLYDRNPVHEPAVMVRLIDRQRRVVLGWYGYQKRYTVEQAKANLRRALQSLEFEPGLDDRFADYEKWRGNDWMEAYFENNKLLIAALQKFGLELPFQGYIGSVSSWESKGEWSVAIDGERPASLHLVRQVGVLPASSTIPAAPVTCFRIESGEWKQHAGPGAEAISSDLRRSFADALKDKSKTYVFRVYRFNYWQELPKDGNGSAEWIEQSREDSAKDVGKF